MMTSFHHLLWVKPGASSSLGACELLTKLSSSSGKMEQKHLGPKGSGTDLCLSSFLNDSTDAPTYMVDTSNIQLFTF